MTATVPIEMANHAAAMAPARRIAEPEELAAAIVFFAGDDASVIHGLTLAVDGAGQRCSACRR
jgi:NAD(P)-dependent dehydrogenase (short-subunit alcohol dehydrogenase family)